MFDIEVDPQALAHETHEDFVAWCQCGYRRAESSDLDRFGGWVLKDGQWSCPL